MRLGIAIEETWSFFAEIYADLQEHHQTTLFKPRVYGLPVFNTRLNRFIFRRDLQNFLQANDVVFFEWASGLLAAASHLPKRCGIVTRLHRYEMYEWADKINWNRVDKVILVSKAKQREFVGKFPHQAGKSLVINEAVPLAKFQPVAKPFTGALGILCHLTPRKRVYDLMLTFYELCQEREDFHLHIAGGPKQGYGDYYAALHDLVRRLGLEAKVTFYGHVADTAHWYQKIDIFISNSYSEGLQVAPMEAMASGCYCLSHWWDGADELLPTELLCYSGMELRQKILAYAAISEREKHERREQMRRLAVERFDINCAKRQIRLLIEETAARRDQ